MARKPKADKTQANANASAAESPPETNAEVAERDSPTYVSDARKPDFDPKEFELPDSSFDPEVDAAVAPKPQAKTKHKAQEAEETRETPAVPAHLLRQATDLGVTSDELEGMAAEDVRAMVNDLRQEAIYRATVKAAAPPEAPKDEFDELDPEDYDPKLFGIIKNQHQKLKAIESHASEQAFLAVEAKIESLFGGLGDAYKDVFGDGTLADIGLKSAEAKRRGALLRAVGLSPADPRFPQAFRETVKSVYGGVLPQGESRISGRITADEWKNGKLQRPTARKQPLPKGPDSATRAVAARMRDMGITDADFDDAEQGGI